MEPYITCIVEAHQTSKGNFFCREVGKSLNMHPIDWPIFVSCDFEDKMEKLPIYGIIIIDYNTQFFNGESRLTCRVLSHDYRELEKIFLDQLELDRLCGQ